MLHGIVGLRTDRSLRPTKNALVLDWLILFLNKFSEKLKIIKFLNFCGPYIAGFFGYWRHCTCSSQVVHPNCFRPEVTDLAAAILASSESTSFYPLHCVESSVTDRKSVGSDDAILV